MPRRERCIVPGVPCHVTQRGVGGERGQPELCDFPETLASAEALPGICLGVNDVSSPASLAT